ncbi:MAG TPA: M13 family metallopeptidase, partial [Thermoanaerobaculia bacterium]|nr:M13 family metallopeptidase [Thermoanaerobaculia bacterium]
AAVASPADVARAVARHQLAYDGSVLLVAGVAPDRRDSSLNALYFGPGARTLNRRESLDAAAGEVRRQFRDHVAVILGLAGDDQEAAGRGADAVLAVERQLAAGTLSAAGARDPEATYHRLALADAQALMPSFDLAAFLAALGVAAPETAIVTQPEALRAVERVLSGRPREELQTYLRWKLLDATARHLSQPFRDADRAFRDQRQGLAESPPRERLVIGEIRQLLAHPLSRLYVEAHFPESTRRAVVGLVGRVRAELRERLATNPWLSAGARKTAVDKLDRVVVDVGYPEEWIDYGGVEIASDDHLGNVRRLIEHDARRQLARLGQPVERDPFGRPGSTTPVDVNAAYQANHNAIEITAAIAQPPFFDPAADDAVNLGTLGAVVGHELTHGFDSRGRLFDADGDLADWWTDGDEAEFAARTRVLAEQYAAYEVLPGVHQDGRLTVAESTADLGGVTLAMAALGRALTDLPADTPRPPVVDGLSAEQRCLLAWAQLWRSKARPELLRQLAATDPHPVSALRAAGPLVHLDAFFVAFGITEADPMWRPPGERVRIW